ncbi:hypothetical protein SRHO_G00041920 [Serrasalmus rhombeus]
MTPSLIISPPKIRHGRAGLAGKKGHLILSDWGGNDAVDSGTTITSIGRCEELYFHVSPTEPHVLSVSCCLLTAVFVHCTASFSKRTRDGRSSVRPAHREWTPLPQPVYDFGPNRNAK